MTWLAFAVAVVALLSALLRVLAALVPPPYWRDDTDDYRDAVAAELTDKDRQP